MGEIKTLFTKSNKEKCQMDAESTCSFHVLLLAETYSRSPAIKILGAEVAKG